ncbi:MAG: C-GCAxxG-C-C family protein [Thermodesulfobacteriota bacterium]
MEERKDDVTRRSFMVNGSAAVGAIGLVAGLGVGSLVDVRKAQAAKTTILKFPALPLDVEKVRLWGYCEYHANGGCGQGTGRALVMGFIEAARKAGMKETGWSLLPPKFTQWGRAGGLDWGGTCGSLTGCLSILNLAEHKGELLHDKLGGSLIDWYTKQNFPFTGWDGVKIDRKAYPNVPAPIPDAEVMARDIPESMLCHVSVTKWMKAAGADLTTKTKDGRNVKKDRCAKVTGATAARAAELINAYLANAAIPAFAPTADYAECYSCHSAAQNVQGKQNCTPCHQEGTATLIGKDHP